jgi:hypothetical protein
VGGQLSTLAKAFTRVGVYVTTIAVACVALIGYFIFSGPGTYERCVGSENPLQPKTMKNCLRRFSREIDVPAKVSYWSGDRGSVNISAHPLDNDYFITRGFFQFSRSSCEESSPIDFEQEQSVESSPLDTIPDTMPDGDAFFVVSDVMSVAPPRCVRARLVGKVK